MTDPHTMKVIGKLLDLSVDHGINRLDNAIANYYFGFMKSLSYDTPDRVKIVKRYEKLIEALEVIVKNPVFPGR
jgi:phosphoglycerate-specific signal transduction histidine kinase